MKKILIFILLSIYLNANTIVDIDDTIKLAQKQEKEIMLFFHIPNCSYCKAMLDENFHNKDILDEIEHNFILLDLFTADTHLIKYKDFKGSVKEFAIYIGAPVYPATIFIDTNKKILYRSIGYRNTQEHLMEIKYVSSENYNKLTLEEFILKTELEEDD